VLEKQLLTDFRIEACAVTDCSWFRSRLKSLNLFSLCSIAVLAFVAVAPAFAGGPKYVAGVSYFDPGVLGQPIVWAGGRVGYFVDQGTLGPLSNAQAKVMVDAAAVVWNAVPTAAMQFTDAGSLAEDVNGGNVVAASGAGICPAQRCLRDGDFDAGRGDF
jgi:hypothetical protein